MKVEMERGVAIDAARHKTKQQNSTKKATTENNANNQKKKTKQTNQQTDKKKIETKRMTPTRCGDEVEMRDENAMR